MYVDSNLDAFPTSMVPVMEIMISELEPLLWKYQVNLALWAHHHSYQRHAAVYDNTVIMKSEPRTIFDDNGIPSILSVYDNPQATVHMVLGTGGADFNLEDSGETEDLPFPDGDPSETWYPWTEIFFYKYGLTRVTALNDTHLDISFKDSIDGKVCDHAMIIFYSDTNDPSWNIDRNNGDILGIAVAGVNVALLCIVTIHILHSRTSRSIF